MIAQAAANSGTGSTTSSGHGIQTIASGLRQPMELVACKRTISSPHDNLLRQAALTSAVPRRYFETSSLATTNHFRSTVVSNAAAWFRYTAVGGALQQASGEELHFILFRI